VDLIPYFLALAAWAGFAVFAVLLSPLNALLRLVRRLRGAPPAGPKNMTTDAAVPESSPDDRRDKARA
jgi:hypothetical protein